jgi:hypothetical protein
MAWHEPDWAKGRFDSIDSYEEHRKRVSRLERHRPHIGDELALLAEVGTTVLVAEPRLDLNGERSRATPLVNDNVNAFIVDKAR